MQASIMQTGLATWTTDPARWAGEFQGTALHSEVSIIFTRLDRPGTGAALHRHPYAETFLVRQGTVVFTDGTRSFEATAGQIVVVPAGMPHGFTGKGCPVEMIDIHASPVFVTEWLDAPSTLPTQQET